MPFTTFLRRATFHSTWHRCSSGFGLAALLVLLSGLTPAAAKAAGDPAVGSILEPAAGLREIRSREGVLVATMEAREAPVRLGQVVIPGAVYNQDYAGPVLRVHPGDLMRIRLVNHLGRATNLHFHGIDTSPLGNSDNMHISVQAGDSFDYEVRIPATQPPGLYWYHDHTHGISRQNVMGGLSGALVVEGFREQFPSLAGVREQILVLKDYQFEDNDDPYASKVLHKYVQTVNGQVQAHLSMRPGETQLWRISNQASDNFFHLRLPGCTLRVIGQDGSAALQETAVEQIDIMPASRLEVLVTAGAAGHSLLRSEGVLTGEGKNKVNFRVLADVEVGGSAAATAGPLTAFPPREDLRQRRIDAYRTVRFSQVEDEETYLIDGKTFDHARTDTRVPLGNVEEWTIRNESDDFHEFHIHQVSFQVVEINGEPQPFRGYNDNVQVPERGEVKVRMAFTDPVIVGRFMYHCHVLKHEDHGMMANIEVYDPAAP